MSKISPIYKLLNSRSVYTRDKNVIGKNKGKYDSDEWSKTREINYVFFSNPSNQNFIDMISDDQSKISAAQELASKFNFLKVNKIGDIGGVPFSQAWTIKNIYPHLKFYLTDYDRKSIKTFLECSIFQSNDFILEKFDAIHDNLDIFDDCDLLTMWGVDYALDDSNLLNIFNYLKKNNKKMLLASLNHENDNIFKNTIRIIFNSLESLIGLSRYHGILRNNKYFEYLCNSVGIKLKLVSVTEGYRIYLIN